MNAIIGKVQMPRILVVDDERDISGLIREILMAEGFRVDVALNGEQCLDKLQKHEFDLITLDIFMPGMNGWDVLKRVRDNERLKSLPVIIFTISELESDYQKAKNLNALFLRKICDKELLLPKIKELIEKSRENEVPKEKKHKGHE